MEMNLKKIIKSLGINSNLEIAVLSKLKKEERYILSQYATKLFHKDFENLLEDGINCMVNAPIDTIKFDSLDNNSCTKIEKIIVGDGTTADYYFTFYERDNRMINDVFEYAKIVMPKPNHFYSPTKMTLQMLNENNCHDVINIQIWKINDINFDYRIEIF